MALSLLLLAILMVANGAIALTSHPKRPRVLRQLNPRADCRTITVVSGDSCGALATKCGITAAQLTTFNPSPTLCSTLQVGQRVCCSAGTLPDLTPKPNPDGSCFVYNVKSGDFCAAIASAHSITAAQIESFNGQTWGWTGCSGLQSGAAICLSTGTPPMPAAFADAVCGPQVVGTQKPAAGIALASLNPCPLRACCDIWGQCGTTPEFCTPSQSSTGAPGTAAPGTNGCISNCGTNIISSGTPVNQFMRLGYYEAWSGTRSCLTMDVSDINFIGSNIYTHVHFAFATITTDFKVSIDSDTAAQFNKFKAVPEGSFKKILSFGGWSFSTDVDSFPIFRNGVTSANRQTFANNVVSFIVANGLDGVDFDWEYPGAPDIPGIPPGSPTDGPNYLEFLKMVRAILPAGKTISIAAPASYWYLKGFPIEAMAPVLDYIVYMTYDLHGQWDYGSAFSSPGCPNGDCLRSHVNFTETLNALSMVTKAGVPSNKILVGVSSYGRSFKGTTAGCTGPMCRYVGPNSGAAPGPCTSEPGYIANAEINNIIATHTNAKATYDSDSHSNILLYDDVQWVAYMDNAEKSRRAAFYSQLNFAGTSDWAIDLAAFAGDSICPASFPNCDRNQFTTIGPNGVNWRTVKCTNPWITDAAQNPKDRWFGIGSDSAWKDALDYYAANKGRGGLVFTETISNFFHGPESMDCGSTSQNNGCTGTSLECSDIKGSDTGPAGYFILNSFLNVEKMILDFYAGITSTVQIMTLQLGVFTKTFAPTEPKLDFFKLALDIFGLGFALSAAPIWAKYIKNLPFYQVNTDGFDILKDSVNAIVANGVTILGDIQLPPQVITHQDQVELTLAQLTAGYRNVTEKVNGALFSGDNTSELSSLIAEGAFLLAGTQNNTLIQEIITRSLYGLLIPYAWSLSDMGPFVLATGSDCQPGQPAPALPAHLTSLDAGRTGSCYKGKQYYLVATDGNNPVTCPAFPPSAPCVENFFGAPPGLDGLQGTAWGGVTRDDLIAGAVNSFNANQNKNGAPVADPNDKATLNNLYDLGITAPGVINIPVCGADEAFNNWDSVSKSAHWPCT